jgi:hypothetical protein
MTIYRASPLTHHYLYQCPSAAPSHFWLVRNLRICRCHCDIKRRFAPCPVVCESLLHVWCVTGCDCSSHKFINFQERAPHITTWGSNHMPVTAGGAHTLFLLCSSWGVPYTWPTIAKGTRISHLRTVPRSPQVPVPLSLAVDSSTRLRVHTSTLENAALSLAAEPLVCRSPAPMFYPSPRDLGVSPGPQNNRSA